MVPAASPLPGGGQTWYPSAYGVPSPVPNAAYYPQHYAVPGYDRSGNVHPSMLASTPRTSRGPLESLYGMYSSIGGSPEDKNAEQLAAMQGMKVSIQYLCSLTALTFGTKADSMLILLICPYSHKQYMCGSHCPHIHLATWLQLQRFAYFPFNIFQFWVLVSLKSSGTGRQRV